MEKLIQRLPTSLRSSTLGSKVGRSFKAEARTQERANLQQEQDQGAGKLEESEAQATPLSNQDRCLPEFPSSGLAPDQDLLGQKGAGMIGERGQDVGKIFEAKARTQEQAALQQDQDQGMGRSVDPEAKTTTEPEFGTMKAPNRRPPMLCLSSPPPPRGPSIQQLWGQQLISLNEVEMMGKGCQDDWTPKVWRIIARFLVPGKYLLGIVAGLVLQTKRLTFTEYETIDAKEQQDTTKPDLCPILVHPRSLGPYEGTTPGTPFMTTCLRHPASEAPTPIRPSTGRKNPEPQPYPYSPRSTTAAKLNGYLLPTFDGLDTDIKTKVWRSLQPEGVQLQLTALIHSGDSSLHLA